jgi:DNA-binding beta-propeller fold protein YncE
MWCASELEVSVCSRTNPIEFAQEDLDALGPPGLTPGPAFVRKWHSSTPSLGDMAFDDDGFLYVTAYSTDRIDKYSSDGTLFMQWGSSGAGPGQFAIPQGIAVNEQNVYVADAGNYRIQKFTLDSTLVTEWGQFGLGDGEFASLSWVDVDPDGNVHVEDGWRIQKFTPSGTFISSLPLPSEPYKMAIDESGNYYLTFSGSIQKWAADGTVIWERTSWSGDCGTSVNASLFDFGLTATGDIYVSNLFQDQVLRLTSDGELVTYWGRYGTGDGQFINPTFLAVHPKNGTIYVSDLGTDRIQVFGEDPAPTAVNPVLPANLCLSAYPNPFNPTITISFAIPEVAHVNLSIYDIRGRYIVTLVNKTIAAGPEEIHWDGTNDNGESLSSGVYIYRLKAGNQVIAKKMVLLR